MLGFTNREMVYNALKSEYEIHLEDYKKYLIEDPDNAMKNYLLISYNRVYSVMGHVNKHFSERMYYALYHPAEAGINVEIDVDNLKQTGVPPSVAFGLIFFGLTGKPVSKEKDVKAMNKIGEYVDSLIEKVK